MTAACMAIPFSTCSTSLAQLVCARAVLHTCWFLQALAERGDVKEERTERQIVALLSLPLTSYDPVTVLGLSTYPRVMSLLNPATCKVSLLHLAGWIARILLYIWIQLLDAV